MQHALDFGLEFVREKRWRVAIHPAKGLEAKRMLHYPDF
jgi:hypothetical protein